jgi:hypothetical protein
MKFNMALLRLVALVLFVVAAILFFANKATDVAMGFIGLGLACRVAADVKL